MVGLAGESGSGKSTIAQAILRTLGPPAAITGGSVFFEGQDVTRMSDAELRDFRWRKISLVFQSAMNALNPVLTVGEQIVDAILVHEPGPSSRAKARAIELLRLVGIDRPGYGASTAQPGRTIADWVPDALAVADQLGIDRFVTVGISTGGAYALGLEAAMTEWATATEALEAKA